MKARSLVCVALCLSGCDPQGGSEEGGQTGGEFDTPAGQTGDGTSTVTGLDTGCSDETYRSLLVEALACDEDADCKQVAPVGCLGTIVNNTADVAALTDAYQTAGCLSACPGSSTGAWDPVCINGSCARELRDASFESTCLVRLSDGPADSSVDVHDCGWQPGDEWNCTCNGSPVDVAAPDCSSALATACGLDEPVRGFCEGTHGGCWPDAQLDTGWNCQCEDTSEFINAENEECVHALFEACAEPCAGAYGACTPGDSGRYLCECDYYGATREVSSSACAGALAACDPEESTLPTGCQSFEGFCDDFDGQYVCGCVDGSEMTFDARALAEIASAQDGVAELDQPATLTTSRPGCDQALELACSGAEPPDDTWICSVERVLDEVVTVAECRQIADQPQGNFECTCIISEPGLPSIQTAPSAVGVTMGASCTEAAAIKCFDAE